jgi:hypothetical protein
LTDALLFIGFIPNEGNPGKTGIIFGLVSCFMNSGFTTPESFETIIRVKAEKKEVASSYQAKID